MIEGGTSCVKGITAFTLGIDSTTGASKLVFAWEKSPNMNYAGTPIITSNGFSNPIIWVTDSTTTILFAFDAITGNTLWQSSSSSSTSLDFIYKSIYFVFLFYIYIYLLLILFYFYNLKNN